MLVFHQDTGRIGVLPFSIRTYQDGMMAAKRVLLVESGRFIGGVIYSLFAREEKLNVCEITPEDPRALLRAVREFDPEVVVMDDTQHIEYLNHLLHYLPKSNNLRIVVVNSNCNKVEVYQKQQVPVLNTADLFAML
jgi:chemotaxis response regulator CheB